MQDWMLWFFRDLLIEAEVFKRNRHLPSSHPNTDKKKKCKINFLTE